MKFYSWSLGEYPTDDELLSRIKLLRETAQNLQTLGPYYSMAAHSAISEVYELDMVARARDLGY